MENDRQSLDVRAVVFREGDWWSAQCLEYDVAAQATTLLELRRELGRVLAAQVVLSKRLGRLPFEGMQRAPKKFWRMYEKAQNVPDVIADDEQDATSVPGVVPHLRIVDREPSSALSNRRS